MFKALAKLCLSYLAKYKTTLQQDLEIIQKHTQEHHLSYNEKNCIYLRIAEKRILTKWLDLSQKILPMLEDGVTMKQVQEMSRNINDVAFDQYYNEVLKFLITTKLK
jgi:hypothetical protein